MEGILHELQHYCCIWIHLKCAVSVGVTLWLLHVLYFNLSHSAWLESSFLWCLDVMLIHAHYDALRSQVKTVTRLPPSGRNRACVVPSDSLPNYTLNSWVSKVALFTSRLTTIRRTRKAPSPTKQRRKYLTPHQRSLLPCLQRAKSRSTRWQLLISPSFVSSCFSSARPLPGVNALALARYEPTDSLPVAYPW